VVTSHYHRTPQCLQTKTEYTVWVFHVSRSISDIGVSFLVTQIRQNRFAQYHQFGISTFPLPSMCRFSITCSRGVVQKLCGSTSPLPHFLSPFPLSSPPGLPFKFPSSPCLSFPLEVVITVQISSATRDLMLIQHNKFY